MKPSTAQRAAARVLLGTTSGRGRGQSSTVADFLGLSERKAEPRTEEREATGIHEEMSDLWRRQLSSLVEGGEWEAVARMLDVPVGMLASPSRLSSHLDELWMDYEPAWLDRARAWMTFEERYSDEGVLMSRLRVEPDGIQWERASERVRAEAQGMVDQGDVLGACKMLGLPLSAASNPDRLAVAFADHDIELSEPSWWEQLKEATTIVEWASERFDWRDAPTREVIEEAQAEATVEARPVFPAPKGFGLEVVNGRLVRNLDDEALVEQIRETSPQVLQRWGTLAPTETVDAEAEVRARVNAWRWGEVTYSAVEETAVEVLGQGRRAETLAAELYEARVEALVEQEEGWR